MVYGLAYIAPTAPLSTLYFVWDAANGLIVLAYVLGAICMYFTARSYATMSDAVQSAGSVYGFARFALGQSAGFIAGWLILLDYLLIPALVYVLMSVALGTLIPGIDRGIWIVLLVAVTLAINWFGVTVTSRVNYVSVGVQLAVMLLLLGCGVVALYSGKGSGGLTLAPVYSAAAFDAGRVFTATSICVNAFLGFDAISTLGEEVRSDDRRIIGKAIITVLLLAATLFVIASWVLGNLMVGFTVKDPAAGVYEVAAATIGPWMALLVAWCFATVVGVTNALPMQVGVARVLFAMGRDRQLPGALALVHPRWGTPWVGMLATAAISLTVAFAMRNELDQLASLVNFGALCGFLLLHLSVLVRFGIRGAEPRWFVHRIVPVCGIAVVLAVLSGMSSLAIRVGLAWLAVGIVYGAVLRTRGRPPAVPVGK